MTDKTLIEELNELDQAITDFVSARKRIEEIASRIKRLPREYEPDPDHPEHIWLNAFSCIRPTDEFAADVGRTLINQVMTSRGRKTTVTVNAS